MAYGDIGGSVTELVITCQTRDIGCVAIRKGDPVELVGDYTVDNPYEIGDPVFGQALADADTNGATIPVKVRGVAVFEYIDNPPIVDGVQGVATIDVVGKVGAPVSGNGSGINLKVDTEAKQVHVLL